MSPVSPEQSAPPDNRPAIAGRRPTPPAPPTFWSWAWLPLLAAAALLFHGPIEQWAGYHDFADHHAWQGVPNAMNVLSNLPFAVVGIAGFVALFRLRRATTPGRAGGTGAGPGHAAWLFFAAAIACTALGSSYYHWSPDNASLVWDRLPIAWACATLSCALLAERVDPRWGNSWSLAAALLAGTAGVAWWWWTVAPNGPLEGGDLRAYLFVQFLPMALIPLLSRRPALHPRALGMRAAWAALALYAAAKALESGDHAVMQTLHWTGGHPLKHLLAAAGAALLLWDACGTRRAPASR